MQLFFEDSSYTIDSFLTLSRKRLDENKDSEWKQSLFNFFCQWHNSEDTLAVFTSGTTGTPKKILLKKKHLIYSAKATLQFLKIPSKGTVWLGLSAEYIAGKMMIVRALTGDLDLWISEPSGSPTLPPLANINLAAMVPMQLHEYVKHTEIFKKLNQQIQNMLVGGSAIPPTLEKKLHQSTSIKYWHTYGMTETISHIALRRINGIAASHWFKPFAGVFISQNEQGCLIIDYPAIKISNLVTNDLINLKNGAFCIEGRADFIINSGGIKINPEAIERKLHDKLPAVFFATGMEDEKLGEKLILIIEDKGNLLPKICDFWKIIEDQLNKIEIPREIYFINSFVRTKNGKLLRNATKEKIIGN